MPKFRKKPVVIEAHQWFKNGDHPEVLSKNKLFKHYLHASNHKCTQCNHIMDDHGWIDTPENKLLVCSGDWVIKGSKSKFYPLSPDMFEQTYEPIKEVSC